jgi:DNA repair ATPase RecN
MSSTSINKKEIVDFLWEWTEHKGTWAELLVNKIVSTENELSQTDTQTIFNYFLQSIGLFNGLPNITIAKPNYTPTNQEIELVSLSDILGVNRLAKNQTINFSPNLTVVFGENGTGKTGYGRILKTLGFSYDSYNNILSDISKTAEPQSAIINFKANSISKTFNWNGSNSIQELENISVFNNNCVSISLNDRQLIVTPIGFHLFNLITAELNKIEQLLNNEIAKYPTVLNWSNTLNNGTPQQLFITTLSNNSTEERLNQISTYTNLQETELTETETELSNLNKALLQRDIQSLTASISEISTIITKIENAQKHLNITEWNLLLDRNVKILDLESQANKGIKEIAETNGIEFYQSLEFENFIKSAEAYIKIIGKEDYPDNGNNCIYCQQPLQNTATELLKNYRLLLNDKTQESLISLKLQKSNFINLVSQIDPNVTLNQSTFGVDDENRIIQPNELIEYNKSLVTLKQLYISDKVNNETKFDLDYPKYLKFCNDKKTELNATLILKTGLLTNIATKEIQLKAKIAELKDRKLVNTKIVEIKKSISNHKTIALLNSNYNNFNTKSISRKTTEAREELVQQNFNTIFKKELKSFKKGHISIDLNFGTSRGNSKISHRINSHSLLEILSEGEQKAIALSEFLTELQLDNIKAPVIFDDPVNSLDHNIIDDVARRLIKLSSERQVVIFTHSVLLFNSFLHLSELATNKVLQCEFYNTSNNFGETGFITDGKKINSVTSYIKKINTILNTPQVGRNEVDVAEDCYGFLRSAIELCVETEIFQGTIKRYQKNVALTSFLKINGDKINIHKEKLNEIFERCCGFIKGHSNPEEIHNDPTLIDLKTDFDEFKTIRDEFIKP